jgi:UDP-N-acetylglucosamine diphosphorylase/glucosamine-1-phosphate N-acetyltransferase
MQNIILFDPEARKHLLPLAATRPVGEFRLGILTLREKWERLFRAPVSYITQDYLQNRYPIHIGSDNLVINACIVPDQAAYSLFRTLQTGQALIRHDELLAVRLDEAQFELLVSDEALGNLDGRNLEDDAPITVFSRLWQLNSLNAQALLHDFDLLTRGRKSQPLSDTNRVIGPHPVFLEEGAKAECCVFQTTNGPIYIGKNAEIMEGCLLRGPIAVCDQAVLKMGAKIYGPTTIGPGCKVGGEVARTILFANSNKAHDGFLGDSVIGAWCNFGADSNNSNLKNNYSEVRLWDYAEERFAKTGEQFCGLFMGDHSKCAINTSFNTGTVVGVFANLYGAGFHRNFVPDFSWGGPEAGYRTYRFDEAREVAQAVMARRGKELTELDQAILSRIFADTAVFRTWEKNA